MSKISKTYDLRGKLWIYPGAAANWYFVTVPKKVSSEIKEKFGTHAKGFGSLPVEVTIGKTVWKTSIFPDKYSGTYFLPIKAKVRTQEGLYADETVRFKFTVR